MLPLVDHIERLEAQLELTKTDTKQLSGTVEKDLQSSFRSHAREVISTMTDRATDLLDMWASLEKSIVHWEKYVQAIRLDAPKALRMEHSRLQTELGTLDSDMENVALQRSVAATEAHSALADRARGIEDKIAEYTRGLQTVGIDTQLTLLE
ncbi:MAG: hypothetical protein KVP17_002271 [Porospora cf. gigantea B]|uniref:uncharacterized protein n=1 Tax=Porospora cf. gigantea B TaxID=2853592 RepID=UPI003571F497|nr:MAG: hypothetical protein KVP17_002271 [Porospora cf. gigantea B]